MLEPAPLRGVGPRRRRRAGRGRGDAIPSVGGKTGEPAGRGRGGRVRKSPHKCIFSVATTGPLEVQTTGAAARPDCHISTGVLTWEFEVVNGSGHRFAPACARCRCDACREGHRLLCATKRRRRRVQRICGACGVRWSGTRFRCPPCAEDHAAWELSRRRRMCGESRGQGG